MSVPTWRITGADGTVRALPTAWQSEVERLLALKLVRNLMAAYQATEWSLTIDGEVASHGNAIDPGPHGLFEWASIPMIDRVLTRMIWEGAL